MSVGCTCLRVAVSMPVTVAGHAAGIGASAGLLAGEALGTQLTVAPAKACRALTHLHP